MVFDYFACNGWKLFLCFLFFTSCGIKREANQLYNQDLFDSVSREGWSSTSDHWRWEDDVLVGETTEENPLDQSSFFIWNKEVENFTLSIFFLEFPIMVTVGFITAVSRDLPAMMLF